MNCFLATLCFGLASGVGVGEQVIFADLVGRSVGSIVRKLGEPTRFHRRDDGFPHRLEYVIPSIGLVEFRFRLLPDTSPAVPRRDQVEMESLVWQPIEPVSVKALSEKFGIDPTGFSAPMRCSVSTEGEARDYTYLTKVSDAAPAKRIAFILAEHVGKADDRIKSVTFYPDWGQYERAVSFGPEGNISLLLGEPFVIPKSDWTMYAFAGGDGVARWSNDAYVLNVLKVGQNPFAVYAHVSLPGYIKGCRYRVAMTVESEQPRIIGLHFRERDGKMVQSYPAKEFSVKGRSERIEYEFEPTNGFSAQSIVAIGVGSALGEVRIRDFSLRIVSAKSG